LIRHYHFEGKENCRQTGLCEHSELLLLYRINVVGAAIVGGTPAQFLLAAAAFGTLAVGAAVAGRLIAGDLFNKNQTSAQNSFNQQTARARGQGSGNGGQVYSGYGDASQILNIGANTPFGSNQNAQDSFFARLKDSLKSEITLRIKSNDSHIIEDIQENPNNRYRGIFETL